MSRLRAAGIGTDAEPRQEDFGWYFNVTAPRLRLWQAAAAIDASELRRGVEVFASSSAVAILCMRTSNRIVPVL
jgi:hypothetical protein